MARSPATAKRLHPSGRAGNTSGRGRRVLRVTNSREAAAGLRGPGPRSRPRRSPAPRRPPRPSSTDPAFPSPNLSGDEDRQRDVDGFREFRGQSIVHTAQGFPRKFGNKTTATPRTASANWLQCPLERAGSPGANHASGPRSDLGLRSWGTAPAVPGCSPRACRGTRRGSRKPSAAESGRRAPRFAET